MNTQNITPTQTLIKIAAMFEIAPGLDMVEELNKFIKEGNRLEKIERTLNARLDSRNKTLDQANALIDEIRSLLQIPPQMSIMEGLKESLQRGEREAVSVSLANATNEKLDEARQIFETIRKISKCPDGESLCGWIEGVFNNGKSVKVACGLAEDAPAGAVIEAIITLKRNIEEVDKCLSLPTVGTSHAERLLEIGKLQRSIEVFQDHMVDNAERINDALGFAKGVANPGQVAGIKDLKAALTQWKKWEGNRALDLKDTRAAYSNLKMAINEIVGTTDSRGTIKQVIVALKSHIENVKKSQSTWNDLAMARIMRLLDLDPLNTPIEKIAETIKNLKTKASSPPIEAISDLANEELKEISNLLSLPIQAKKDSRAFSIKSLISKAQHFEESFNREQRLGLEAMEEINKALEINRSANQQERMEEILKLMLSNKNQAYALTVYQREGKELNFQLMIKEEARHPHRLEAVQNLKRENEDGRAAFNAAYAEQKVVGTEITKSSPPASDEQKLLDGYAAFYQSVCDDIGLPHADRTFNNVLAKLRAHFKHMSTQWSELRDISGCPPSYPLKEWLAQQRRRLESENMDLKTSEPRRVLAIAKEYILEIHETLNAGFDETTLSAARRVMLENAQRLDRPRQRA